MRTNELILDSSQQPLATYEFHMTFYYVLLCVVRVQITNEHKSDPLSLDLRDQDRLFYTDLWQS